MEATLAALAALEAALGPFSRGARAQLTVVREQVAGLRGRLTSAEAEGARYREMLARTVAITRAGGVNPVAAEVLEGMMRVSGAARGFIGLVEPGGWRLLVERAQGARHVADPGVVVSTGIVSRVLRGGEAFVAGDAGHHPALRENQSVKLQRLRSVACLPIGPADGPLGFVYLDHPDLPDLFDLASVAALSVWLPLLGDALGRAIRAEAREEPALPGVITRSPILRAELHELARVAPFNVSILLTGETGTGKSLIAQRIHAVSPRGARPFVHVNCGAIPESLLEGELFGSEAGAYTGAKARREGRFEAAQGGTLFLDEIDTMTPACQSRLLVVLQERQITRLGSSKPVAVDVRVIAAMGSDPQRAVAEGRLREDLYYRLSVIVARLPPLRARPEDLPLLAEHMLERGRARYGLPAITLTPAALDEIVAYDWPGNVRELENALDRAALLCEGGRITTMRLPARGGSPAPASMPSAMSSARRGSVLEDEFREAWAAHGGKAEAVAAALGIHVRSVFRHKKRFIDGDVD